MEMLRNNGSLSCCSEDIPAAFYLLKNGTGNETSGQESSALGIFLTEDQEHSLLVSGSLDAHLSYWRMDACLPFLLTHLWLKLLFLPHSGRGSFHCKNCKKKVLFLFLIEKPLLLSFPCISLAKRRRKIALSPAHNGMVPIQITSLIVAF